MGNAFTGNASFKRGQTLYGGSPPSTTTDVVDILGEQIIQKDTENSTSKHVLLRAVQNTSGGTLTGRRPLKYEIGFFGRRVDGYATAVCHGPVAGYIDDAYGTKTIADKDVFWIVEEGPCDRGGRTDYTELSVTELMTNELSLIKVVDDFTKFYDTTSLPTWTLTGDATALIIVDGNDGGVELDSGAATDNNETYMHTNVECFKFAAGKDIFFEVELTATEASTNEISLLVGLMDAVAANSLLDDGGGPPASYSGLVFFKASGDTVWQGEASVTTTQKVDTDVGTRISGTRQILRLEMFSTSSTVATVKWFVDGVLGGTETAFTYTSGTDMECVVGVKNGSANQEKVTVHSVAFGQLR